MQRRSHSWARARRNHPRASLLPRPVGPLPPTIILVDRRRGRLVAEGDACAVRGNREQEDRRRQYRRERDEAIAALIHPEDKGDYDQILKVYSEKVGEMEREWRTSFQASVEKTARVVVLHEAPRRLGYGAEIAAEIGERCFWALDQPVTRIGALNTPIPTSPPLEDAMLPSTAQVIDTVRKVATS